MREIKFRAWDKIKKVMFIPRTISQSPPFCVFDNENFRLDLPDDCELMQYTGLKDKNGDKDIYEGDIIEMRHDDFYDGLCRRFSCRHQELIYLTTICFSLYTTICGLSLNKLIFPVMHTSLSLINSSGFSLNICLASAHITTVSGALGYLSPAFNRVGVSLLRSRKMPP